MRDSLRFNIALSLTNGMNQSRVSKMTAYSAALMIITSIHHVYGAAVYHTPWRLHVLMVSIPVLTVTLVLYRIVRNKEPHFKSIPHWIFFLVTLIPSAGLIGIYEGLYNHILKNLLFFGGANDDLLQQLFPAPAYEMPNNVFFEITGIIQGIIALPLIIGLIEFTGHAVKKVQTKQR
jgi:hypothetical protein